MAREQDREQDQQRDHERDEDQEALRLMKAFYKISDREARRIIIAIVEAAAHGASVKIEEPSELGKAILGRNSSGQNTSH